MAGRSRWLSLEKAGSSRRRGGFVLLMSLMLIVLAALLLAGLARHSLSVGSQSYETRQELQRRWGTMSLSRAVLYRADQVLNEHERTDSTSVAGREEL